MTVRGQLDKNSGYRLDLDWGTLLGILSMDVDDFKTLEKYDFSIKRIKIYSIISVFVVLKSNIRWADLIYRS